MVTLLHISDLHRTSGPRLSNDDLLSAIRSDARRWDVEGIPRPDLIVVSGDLVKGAGIDSGEADAEISAQYREVGDFLARLADEFVSSDHSRVVIVPGNHDVHWKRSRDAMQQVVKCPEDIGVESVQATSPWRWSWKDLRAYSVCDRALYEARFEFFREFRTRFYDGYSPAPLSHGDDDLIFAEYPDIGLAIAGFASWYGNDCFCHVGEISPHALAVAERLVGESTSQVAVAVWHHSIVGGPRQYDYMDQRVVHRLIDFGFTIGLHGHQHFSGAAPFELKLPNQTSMVVVGAGSLAVGDRQLPMGERRQYNVVVVDPRSQCITVHVRAMSAGGVFAGSYRDDFGGNTFLELKLPARRTGKKSPSDRQILDDALAALATERYGEALNLVEKVAAGDAPTKRQIKVGALEGLGRTKELMELLNPPRNADEANKLIALFLDEGCFDAASACLSASAGFLDKGIVEALAGVIAARRMIP